MKKEGFTLIELVIVIVILGILAAVAVPKFVGLTKDAKVSAVNGFAGSLRAASNIVHAKWLVNDNNSDTVNVEGTSVSVDNNTNDKVPGYPNASTDGIVKAVNYDNGTFKENCSNDNCTFSYKGNNGCSVSYYYDGNEAPQITADTSNCK